MLVKKKRLRRQKYLFLFALVLFVYMCVSEIARARVRACVLVHSLTCPFPPHFFSPSIDQRPEDVDLLLREVPRHCRVDGLARAANQRKPQPRFRFSLARCRHLACLPPVSMRNLS